MAVVDINSISFYQPPKATVSKRGPSSSPRSVGITSVGFVFAGSSQVNQWDMLLQQYDSTGNIRIEALITRQDDLGGGGLTPRGSGADRAGLAPASEGLTVAKADDETEDEYPLRWRSC